FWPLRSTVTIRRAASSRGAAVPAGRTADEAVMRTIAAVILAAAVQGAAVTPAAGGGPGPGWALIPRQGSPISPAQGWNGPPLDAGEDGWRNDDALAALSATIASRRIEMADAKTKIASFANAAGADRDRRLTLLFAGVLANINDERSSIMAGIGRYARRQ